jgi:hypothetical protein
MGASTPPSGPQPAVVASPGPGHADPGLAGPTTRPPGSCRRSPRSNRTSTLLSSASVPSPLPMQPDRPDLPTVSSRPTTSPTPLSSLASPFPGADASWLHPILATPCRPAPSRANSPK